MQTSTQTSEPGTGGMTEACDDPPPENVVVGAASEGDRLRAQTYSLLAALLARPPGGDLLEMMAQIDEPGDEVDEMATAWRVLKLAAERSEVDAVDDEYHDLFIGVGRGELVPYGSWYLTGLLMDRPLAVLRGHLAALGIERTEDTHEPEDHASALCETMMLLITSDDIDTDDEREFFKQHMEPWLDVFFRDLQMARSACFYRAVGRLGQAFVNLESRYLAMPV